MKIIGALLMILAVALIVYMGMLYFNRSTEIVSPLPEDKGVKVILLTPAP